MNGLGATIRNYAELSRISNLPTVWSNVLVGVVLAAPDFIAWKSVLAIGAGISLLYVAGMAFNDAFDAELDRVERPRRVIPSGRISLRAAVIFAGLCMAVGWIITSLHGLQAMAGATVLVITIIAYDLVHKATAASVLLMGACRGLVYAIAATAMAWPIGGAELAWTGGAVTVYVILLSIVARVEAKAHAGGRGWAALLLPLVAVAPAIGLRIEPMWLGIAAAGVPVLWLLMSLRHLRASPSRISNAVQNWLAGICLIDGLSLTMLGRPGLSFAALLCFAVTILGHRTIRGS